MPNSLTGYARLKPWQARVVWGVIAASTAFCVGVSISPLRSDNFRSRQSGGSDVALYAAEVERIAHGEGYYQAAAAELVARGYPTRSVFNWRPPLPMWLLGKLPTPRIGQVLLGALGALLLLMGFRAAALEEQPATHLSLQPFICALLLIGAVLPTFLDKLYVVPILWSGTFLGLSISAYGLQRPYWGVGFGVAAVFLRELALPYCLLAAFLAWRAGRRREVMAWLVGLAAWLSYYGVHCYKAWSLITPDARAHAHGWLCFSGAAFVISTVQMNAFLLLLPQWVSAIYLVAALVGFAGWNTPQGTRVGLSACVFIIAFAFVGQSFNQYWGSLIAPLLCFGAAQTPAALRDLYLAAVPRWKPAATA